MAEEILATMETADKKLLSFTPNRVIVAKYGTKLKLTFPGMWLIVGAIGEAILKSIEARRERKKEELRKLSAESRLKADKKNFAIPYAEMTKVEFSKKGSMWKMKITAGARKHEFALTDVFRRDLEELTEVLPPIWADKVSIS